MISKRLTIAAAIVLLSGLTAGQALAETSAPVAIQIAQADQGAAPAAAGAAATPATPDASTAAAPAEAAPPPPAADDQQQKGANPYGLASLWSNGDFVAKSVIILLAVMSIGTWYIFFMKYWEQSRMLNQAKQVERRFWSSNNLNEGIDKLAKNSVFRSVAESGVRASSGQGTGLVNLNDWIGMALARQLEEITSRLQGGIAFLASVGSTAPFVGLFGTVWGIYHALIAIGIAGQASIDKVAGPVGEALIMTAIGLGVAVPAVLLYNFLVRRNKVITEKLKSFAGDLQTYLVTKGK
jgi:biopolymer transport protein ExbB